MISFSLCGFLAFLEVRGNGVITVMGTLSVRSVLGNMV